MRIPIGKVADHLGINVHHSTVIRWHQKGVVVAGKRVVLPATRLGHRLYVDETDLAEFVGHLNDRPAEDAAAPAASRHRKNSRPIQHLIRRPTND